MQAKDVLTGADLRAWRVERGITQAQLAAALDKTQKTISTWEQNEHEAVRLAVREGLMAIESPERSQKLGAWSTVIGQAVNWLMDNGHLVRMPERTVDKFVKRFVTDLAQIELHHNARPNDQA